MSYVLRAKCQLTFEGSMQRLIQGKKPSRKCKNVLSFPRDISNADFAILIIKTQKKNNIH